MPSDTSATSAVSNNGVGGGGGSVPKLKRQTHTYCKNCMSVAEEYNQKQCKVCGFKY